MVYILIFNDLSVYEHFTNINSGRSPVQEKILSLLGSQINSNLIKCIHESTNTLFIAKKQVILTNKNH